MAKEKPQDKPALTSTPLGTSLSAPTGRNISGPADLCGKKVALNLAACAWIELPESRKAINETHPVFDVPEKGLLSDEDMRALFDLVRRRYLVISDVPLPRHVKNADRLAAHLDVLTRNVAFEIVRQHILKVVNGAYMDGGYNKIEILEAMKALENGETKGKGGFRRKKVIDTLNDAIEHVSRVWGGVSPAKSEKEEGVMLPSSSGRNMATRSGIDHKKFAEADLI